MRLIWTYCLCLLIIVAANSSCQLFLPIEPLISQIKVRQVVFLNRGDHQKQQMSSEKSYKMENWIYSSFASQLPCTWINIDKDSALESLQKSNSLFLYVGVEDSVNQHFVKNLKGLTLNFPAPIRALLILFNRKNDSSGRYLDLLKLFWQEQLLEVTIIGISPRVSQDPHKMAITHREIDYIATIHLYNPFTNVYTNRPIDSSSRLFPLKLDDLHGHRLCVGFLEHLPYSLGSQKSKEQMGIFDLMLDVIQSKLNFSIESDFLMNYTLPNGSFTRLIMQTVSERHLDVLVFGAYLVHTKDPYPVDRTTFITFERVCGLVPMISKPTLRLSSSIQWSLLLMLSLVAIVWLSSLLLLRRNGGDSFLLSYWRPLDIGLMMMGASIPAQAVTLRERLLFGCVLVVGLFYSSTILAHLTSLNLDLKAHKKFETYRDLEESGLIPFINPYMFNMTFRESKDPTLHRLGKKAYQNPDDLICLGWLLDHANVSCIFGEKVNWCLLDLYSGRMKQAEPCFWSSYRVIIMRQGSPYTLSFNRIIRAIQESGVISMWWQRFHENSVNSHMNHEKISINSSPRFIETKKRRYRPKNDSYWRVFFLLFAGYVLSLTVFSMELIFKRLYTKLQRQWWRLLRRIAISMK